jgi:diguanylate cyclase (GGDEF)-like protein
VPRSILYPAQPNPPSPAALPSRWAPAPPGARPSAEAEWSAIAAAFDRGGGGACRIDPEGRLGFVTPGFSARLGFAPDDLLGSDWLRLVVPGHREALLAARREMILRGRAEVLLRALRKDGDAFDAEFLLVRAHEVEDRFSGHFLFLHSLPRRGRRDSASNAPAADGERLTSLPDRAAFLERVRAGLDHGIPFAVLLLNLDRFRTVHLGLGHAAGDALLRAVARRLEACCRLGDPLAHLGGDEFAALLEGVSEFERAAAFADRIHREIRPAVLLEGHRLFPTACIGIALGPGPASRPDDLLREAASALRRAKARGAGQTASFDEGLRERVASLARLETDLGKALERGEFRLEYQPVVSLATGSILGCEALLRWLHPDRGLVPPSDFIPLAEETGAIDGIGAWALREACGQARAWDADGLPPLSVAVNVSPVQVRRGGLASLVARALAETGLPAERLRLELTESAATDDSGETVGALRDLERMGIAVAIDDFGTGYSSLARLRRLPLAGLKIDRSFVRGSASDPQDAAIVRALLRLARHLALEVVAEGVETEEQLRFLAARRCDAIQGYYFSPPLPPEAFARLLREGKRLPSHASRPRRSPAAREEGGSSATSRTGAPS